MGVGDVGAVPGGAWRRGDSAGGDDGGGAVGEHVGGVLGGRGEDERDGREEQGGDGVGVGDGAGGGSGAGGDDGDGTGGGDGVRGDGVGFRIIRSLFGLPRYTWITFYSSHEQESDWIVLCYHELRFRFCQLGPSFQQGNQI